MAAVLALPQQLKESRVISLATSEIILIFGGDFWDALLL
jgi:hypothetical protein